MNDKMRGFFKKSLLVIAVVINLFIMGCNQQPVTKQPTEAMEPSQAATNRIVIEEIAVPSISPTAEPTTHPTPEPTTELALIKSILNPILVVKKSERIVELWDGETFIESYDIDIGQSPEGDKQVQGDCKTPEGEYYIGYRNPNSHYYLSLGISYPNRQDAQEALDDGHIDQLTYDKIAEAIENKSQPPSDTSLGGGITLHGRVDDQGWTRGCVAVDNNVMDLFWEICPVGTKITIYP
jgi:hypothetical protein